MSARCFQSLFYTGCRPGQGLRGDAGLQFQAVSAGTTGDTMAVVERSALCGVPEAWVRERAAADFPPSLVHVFDGRYVTARGIHRGSDVDEENDAERFIHAIATTDPELYGRIRPAQLWAAPWWAEGPALTTECPPVPAEPEPGPWSIAAIRDWVLGCDDGEKRLLAVHSAFERVHESDGKRVLFVSADPAHVLRWIAAGTLLLPQERALRIGFRVYAADSGNAAEILGAHPDWAERFVHDNDFVVFDLDNGTIPDVDSTESALHWVPRFLRSDPSVVVDAVELAARYARLIGRTEPNLGDRLASCVMSLGEAEPEHANALADWLLTSPEGATVDSVRQVAAAVMAAGPNVPVLRKLARAVGTGELAGHVRYALLWAEVNEIVQGRITGDPPSLPEREWSPSELEQATHLVEAAAENSVPAERMDQLLRTATRFGITPRVMRFSDAATRFASWWVDHPDAGMDPTLWSSGSQMLHLVRDELAFRMQDVDADQIGGEIREYWWRLLIPTVSDPFQQVDALVAACAVRHGGPERRQAIAALRGHLESPDRPGTGEAVWSALFRLSTPTVDEAREFVSAMPSATVTKALAQKVLAVLDRSAVSASYLDVLRLLVEHVRRPEQEPLLSLWKEDGKLRYWLNGVHRGVQAASVAELRHVSTQVFSARAPEVLDALLGGDLATAADITGQAGEQLQAMLVRELPRVWASHDSADHRHAAVALSFLTAWSDEAAPQLRQHFDKKLEEWARGHDQADYRRVSKLLRVADAESAAAWHEWLREVARRKRPAKPRWPFGR